MSIAAATRNAYAVEVRSESPQFRQASGATTTDSALERVAEWIPSEALGIYIALLGLVTPKGAGRWIVFGIGAVLVPAFALLNAAVVNKRARDKWTQQKKAGNAPQLGGSKLVLVVGLMAVAFLTYAWALPSTPFTDLVSNATVYGGVAAIVLAAFLPRIAELAGVKPPTP